MTRDREQSLRLERLRGRFAVCRLDPGARVADDVLRGELAGVTRTSDETSVVCCMSRAPRGAQVEGPFCAMRVAGTLDFSLTGILASLAGPLAEAGISIFALSTFDTDYLLVREEAIDAAVETLAARGHQIVDRAA